MDNIFKIEFSFQTARGPLTFACFNIGNNKETAANIFSKLKGTDELVEDAVLTLDFSEVRNGLPINLNLLSCTLDELAENSRIITKEMFKALNPEGELGG